MYCEGGCGCTIQPSTLMRGKGENTVTRKLKGLLAAGALLSFLGGYAVTSVFAAPPASASWQCPCGTGGGSCCGQCSAPTS